LSTDGGDSGVIRPRHDSQEPQSAAVADSVSDGDKDVDKDEDKDPGNQHESNAGDNWALMEHEFDATCQRVVQSLRLVGAGRGSQDSAGKAGGEMRVHAPLPPAWLRPWLNAVGITSMVWVWAGFVGMMMGLYLLSAEVWADERGSGWSIVILGGIGLMMLLLGTAAFIQSRRGWLQNALSCLIPAILL